jgi:HAD superfamily hydrolase (TIGR01509 family)
VSSRPGHLIPRAAAVFDCDGLLVSTQGAWDRAYELIAARYGTTISTADRHALVGLQLGPLGHALARLLGHPASAAQLSAQICELVQSAPRSGHAPMPGAVELVTALYGSRPLAVASNTPRGIVVAYLKSAGLAEAFDVVVGSDQVARPKPAPDVYLAACRGVRAEPAGCAAFEDSPAGASAALAAGLYVIGVPSAPDLAFPAHRHADSLADPALWQAMGVRRRARSA